jgi:hypothetical protein
MPANTIVRALDDLMHALKGRRNVKGTSEIEALERIDELLNNSTTYLRNWNRTDGRNDRSDKSHSMKQQHH